MLRLSCATPTGNSSEIPNLRVDEVFFGDYGVLAVDMVPDLVDVDVTRASVTAIPNLGNGKMDALRANKGALETKLDIVDITKLKPQDVLIKVKSVGLSPGPFTLLKLGRLRHLPTTFGHEVLASLRK